MLFIASSPFCGICRFLSKLLSGLLSNYSNKHKTYFFFLLGMRQITKQKIVHLITHTAGLILHYIIALAVGVLVLMWDVIQHRTKIFYSFFLLSNITLCKVSKNH